MGTNPNRSLLTKVRAGDYLHAGDEEILEIILAHIQPILPKSLDSKLLDLGCGLGGTADYFLKKGYKEITGIDIDQSAINYATKKYPNILFKTEDATKISTEIKYDLIYMLNVIYAIEDKKTLINKLSQISNKKAIVVIADYTAKSADNFNITDLSGRNIYPLQLEKTTSLLRENNFTNVEVFDFTDKFILWYDDLLMSLSSKQQELELGYSALVFTKVFNTISHIHEMLKSDVLGGAIIYAYRD